jgi:hypothetical protein
VKFDTLKEAVDFTNIQELHIDGTDERNPHQSWLKGMFRKSEMWREFCKYLIAKKGGLCERCHEDGHDCSGLQVHHRNPKEYQDLNEKNFAVLCGRCHLKIESYCRTEDSMKQCPNDSKQFLTLYPYKEKDQIVIAKGSGTFQIRKWVKEKKITEAPEKYVNNGAIRSMTGVHKKEVKDAVEFMKAHPDLF